MRCIRSHNYLAAGLSVIGLALAAPAEASELLWSSDSDKWTTIESLVSSVPATDVEAADDFDVQGAIERIVVVGQNNCVNSGSWPCDPLPGVTGVIVRFYEWTPAGPGTLQYEQLIPDGAAGLLYDPGGPDTVDITLPAPFEATGQHFFSVQLVFEDCDPSLG